jgi:hypothetical protein
VRRSSPPPAAANRQAPPSSAAAKLRQAANPQLTHLLGVNGVFTALAAHARTHPDTSLVEGFGAGVVFEEELDAALVFGPGAVAVGSDELSVLVGAALF